MYRAPPWTKHGCHPLCDGLSLFGRQLRLAAGQCVCPQRRLSVREQGSNAPDNDQLIGPAHRCFLQNSNVEKVPKRTHGDGWSLTNTADRVGEEAHRHETGVHLFRQCLARFACIDAKRTQKKAVASALAHGTLQGRSPVTRSRVWDVVPLPSVAQIKQAAVCQIMGVVQTGTLGHRAQIGVVVLKLMPVVSQSEGRGLCVF